MGKPTWRRSVTVKPRPSPNGYKRPPGEAARLLLQSRQAANLLSRIFLDTFCYLCGTASVSLWADPPLPTPAPAPAPAP